MSGMKEATMGSSFLRSEKMALCQMFLQSEASYACVSELGELGVVQFIDLNASTTSFNRKFVNEIRRAEEMERKLRFVEKELKKDRIPILDTGEDPAAPGLRKMEDLETSFEKLENELDQVNSNARALKKNFLELTELKHVLRKTQVFFDEVDMKHREASTKPQGLYEEAEALLGTYTESFLAASTSSMQLRFMTGVILREKIPSFEGMLWRACHGNVFLRHSEIDVSLEDPETGEEVRKSVFVVFFQGDQLKMRVKKICEGYRANVYPCPESPAERREMAIGVMTRIEDLNTVLSQTTDHRHRVLVLAARNLRVWTIKTRKYKAIYHMMNMFNLDVTRKCLVAECWAPVDDLERIRLALHRGTTASGSSGPAILNRMHTKKTPPTYNKVNKFTEVFQSIIDSYGISTYGEVNPAPFSIITFPFLFSVMFGDFGHGFIMFLFALWMVVRERQLIAKRSNDEIWNMFFGGRYLILLMGAFSIYSGLIYNDIFSKALNTFGSSWSVSNDMVSNAAWYKESGKRYMLEPNHLINASIRSYSGSPYPFGIDPIWAISENKITFDNSFKQKISVIFGVLQMFLGISLGVINKRHFGKVKHIVAEVIPMFLFLSATFGYLVIIIMVKWTKFNTYDTASPSGKPICAPKLLIGLINMFMLKYPNSTASTPECGFSNSTWYPGQQGLETFLVLLALVCIPWILLGKPLLIRRERQGKGDGRRLLAASRDEYDESGGEEDEVVHHEMVPSALDEEDDDDDDDEHSEENMEFSDIMVHQAIHTIEFCLGCVSHTASYLRLWALSLAHGQLSEVLWNMILRNGLSVWQPWLGGPMVFLVFTPWAVLTVGVLLLMEGLSAFLHTLRLHWVEFMSKFYSGTGYAFLPFTFESLVGDVLHDPSEE